MALRDPLRLALAILALSGAVALLSLAWAEANPIIRIGEARWVRANLLTGQSWSCAVEFGGDSSCKPVEPAARRVLSQHGDARAAASDAASAASDAMAAASEGAPSTTGNPFDPFGQRAPAEEDPYLKYVQPPGR
jgi:hypothetical protein